MNGIPLTVARAPYPVGMVRIYGAEAIALAEQTGVWVDVGPADGRGATTTVPARPSHPRRGGIRCPGVVRGHHAGAGSGHRPRRAGPASHAADGAPRPLFASHRGVVRRREVALPLADVAVLFVEVDKGAREVTREAVMQATASLPDGEA